MNTWNDIIANEQQKPYYKELADFLKEEYANNICYPPKELIFNAFAHTPFNKVKVVILGQDPYHEPNQAMGLSFSVQKGVIKPPSLINIYKEIINECPGALTYSMIDLLPSDLTYWADQGVLLLNSVLTVRKGAAGSHAGHGWEIFTDDIIKELEKSNQPMVYMLWGNYAKNKAIIINNPNHIKLISAHPSPFSANKGFFGNNHFNSCNQFLISKGLTPINWFANH